MGSRIVIVCVFVISFSIAHSVSAQNYWQVQEATAHTSRLLIGEVKDAVATFVVSFGKKNNCRSEIGLMLYASPGLGEHIKKGIAAEKMILNIDGIEFSDKSYFSKYSNGFEVTMYGSKEIIYLLRSSREVAVKISQETQSFSFPLHGSALSINQASKYCNDHYSIN